MLKRSLAALCATVVLAAPAGADPSGRADRSVFETAGSRAANVLAAPVDAHNLATNKLSRTRLGRNLPSMLQDKHLSTGGHRGADFTSAGGNRLTAPAQVNNLAAPKHSRIKNSAGADRAQQME